MFNNSSMITTLRNNTFFAGGVENASWSNEASATLLTTRRDIMKKRLLLGLIIASMVFFTGCLPIGLMLPPTFLPAGGFDIGVGAEVVIGEGFFPWVFEAQPRYAFTDSVEGSMRVGISPFFVEGVFPLYLEAGGRLRLTSSPVISVYGGGGFLTFLGGDGNGAFLPIFRISPTIGFRLGGETFAFLRGQALYAENFLFVIGGGLSGKHWILEGSVPLPFPDEGFGFFLTAGARF